jgi:hypothetical protein
MDATVGVRPRHHRQDRKEQHMGERVELAFGPTRVLDFGQQLKQVGKGIFHGNRSPLRLPHIDSHKARDSNPKSSRHRHFPGPCGFSDSPHVKSVEQPCAMWRPYEHVGFYTGFNLFYADLELNSEDINDLVIYGPTAGIEIRF